MEYDDQAVVDAIFEWGQLKRLPRAGWWRAGVDQPETVAAHNLRVAQIAFVLACMEGHPDPARVCAMAVFHELGETRVSDLDTVAKHYTERAEERATRDQLAQLGELGEQVLQLWRECEHRSTEAGRIAKDADKLEAAFTAREYVETGYPATQEWIDSTKRLLETDAAKRLIERLDRSSFTDWWHRLPGEDEPAKEV